MGSSSCREESLKVRSSSTQGECPNKSGKKHRENLSRFGFLLGYQIPSKPECTAVHEKQEEKYETKNGSKTEPFLSTELSCFIKFRVVPTEGTDLIRI